MVFDSVLPLLDRYHSSTGAAVSYLAGSFEAGCRNENAQDIAKSSFDNAVPAVISVLSFGSLYPKAAQKEPYLYSNFEGYRAYDFYNEIKLVDRVLSFYCRCLSTHHEKEAHSVLRWPGLEVDTADNRVFHTFTFLFLENVYNKFQEYKLSVSYMLQETCQHMVLELLNRCVGMEPAKPTSWTRSLRGCGSKDCLACPRLDEFLRHPAKEIEYFENDQPGYGDGHLHK